MMSRVVDIIAGGILGMSMQSAMALSPPLLDIDFDNSLSAIQRGADLFQTRCMTCHDLKYVKYRHLEELGITIDTHATMPEAYNADRPINSIMPVEDRRSLYGILPPDLSLITKARRGGERYVYSFLLGFSQTAEGGTINNYYPGTIMPDPLGISYVTDDNEIQKIRQQAADIVAFLVWAADPHAGERKRLGYYVLIYLAVLTLLLYLVKRRVWSRLDGQD